MDPVSAKILVWAKMQAVYEVDIRNQTDTCE